MADRHAELLAMLRELKLPAMVEQVADLALKTAKANLMHEAFLYELVQAEVHQREARRGARLLRHSGLPAEKTFRTLHVDRFPPASRSSGCGVRLYASLSQSRGLCRALLTLWPVLWTFVTVPDVELANNADARHPAGGAVVARQLRQPERGRGRVRGPDAVGGSDVSPAEPLAAGLLDGGLYGRSGRPSYPLTPA